MTGTLGILAMGAGHRLLNLRQALNSLKQTNFHYRQELTDEFLNQVERNQTP